MGTDPASSPTQPDGQPALPVIPGITLHREIARGGEGIVYAGRHDFLDREVAVKLLSMELSGEVFSARFRRAAKILAGIKHPNIVACHDAGTLAGGRSYLVMELIDGPNLKRWIATKGALSPGTSLYVARSMVQALGHAHQLKVIHRDIKTENILLESSPAGRTPADFPFLPKLVDLGLARVKAESNRPNSELTELTMPGQAMGTPSTMAPEQFDDPDSVDFRADVYGLGCVLYEMLVGKPAFRSNRLTELVAMKRQPEGPNPVHENPMVAPEVGRLVSRLLAADRERRTESYAALEQELNNHWLQVDRAPKSVSDRILGVDRTQVIPGLLGTNAASTAPARSRAGRNLAVGAALVLAVGAGAAWLALGGASTQQPAGNKPPVLSAGMSLPARAVIGEFFEASVGARDPDGDSLTYSWSAPFAGERVEFAPDNQALVRVRIRSGTPGETLAVKVEVRDGRGGSDARTGTVVVDKTPAAEPPEPEPTKPPRLEDIEAPATVSLGTPFSLVARIADAGATGTRVQWTSPIARVVFVRPEGNRVEARVLDGLPAERFVVRAEVNDGVHPPSARDVTLVIDDKQQSTPLLSDFLASRRWILDGGTWTQLLDTASSVSCRTGGGLHTASTTLQNELCWQLQGDLESEIDDNSMVYAQTGVRIECGDASCSVVLTRRGEFGEEHRLRILRNIVRDGTMVEEAIAGVNDVAWNSDERAEELLGAFTIRRIDDQLLLRIDQPQLKRSSEHVIRVPATQAADRIVLFARDGRGAFRKFRML